MPQCSSIHTTVVDICPCSAMTFHNSRNYMILCRTSGQERFYQDELKSLEPSLACDTGNKQYTHKCIFNDHSLAIVYIKTRLWFDEGSRSLQVQNIFKFDVSWLTYTQLECLGKSEINNCAHQKTKDWLQRFFQNSKVSLDMKVLESDYCQWLGWEESESDEFPRAFKIILHRDLGGVHWPDKRWMKYSHERLRPPRGTNRRFLEASH